ncbi:glycosyltransferase family 4 protein [Geobacter hydrogenophilus]|nr:glycosyltransferase family 4 protein [Geobacter hydrogenophilus]MBT0894781.1 glycosyltransferase family 4 protein [Geobacter hydrogenophilus]
MVAPTPFFADRGCHVRIYEEARALMACGHEVRIVTYHLGRDMAGIATNRTVRIPWYGKLSAGPSWHKPYLDILLFFTALRAARRMHPNLIHAHLHEGAFLGVFLKKLLGIPLLFDCQGSLTGELADHGFARKGSLLYRFFAGLEGWINRNADAIVTSSGAGRDDLVGKWGVPVRKVTAFMDGVDTAVFRPYPRDEVRRRLGIAPQVPLVVFLGVLNRYQGIDLLLSAMVILKAKGSPVRFLVMGFPDEGYREKARELGVDDMVTFTGRIDYGKAPAYLSAGDLAVSPKISLTEANGKLFNYIACGLPTVVFDTPINREILGDAGVYARFGDATDLADRIEALAADAAGRERLGQMGRERAIADHSWQARGKELSEIYRRLVRLAGNRQR